jgi:Ca2+-binding EF-hand superfamily protein
MFVRRSDARQRSDAPRASLRQQCITLRGKGTKQWTWELSLEGALRAGCKDANAHVRASSRRGASAMVILLPKAGQRLLDEVEPGTADLILSESEWVEEQRENCAFGVGDGAAPVHTEDLISAPKLPQGFDPKRVDFRPPGGGPTEDEDRKVRKETSGVTSFQMRQLVKGLPVYLRNILAEAGTRLKEEFRQFDINGDGVVDPGEMRTGLNGMKLGLSAQDIEMIINIVNVYDDGAIDYAEFAMLFGKREHASNLPSCL